MLALRYAAVVALVVWVGGLIALGALAAPAVFETVGATAGGRPLAGAAVGEALRRFHLVSYACGGVLLLSLLLRAILGPRPRRFAVRLLVAAVMVAATLTVGMLIAPQIAQAQREIGVSPSSLPEGDARRASFSRMHAVSTTLELLPVLGGLALVFWELRD